MGFEVWRVVAQTGQVASVRNGVGVLLVVVVVVGGEVGEKEEAIVGSS